MATDPVVYDKAKYHLESVENDGLDEVQAYVHTAFYLRWILENKFFSEEFYEDTKEEIEKFQKGENDRFANLSELGWMFDRRYAQR